MDKRMDCWECGQNIEVDEHHCWSSCEAHKLRLASDAERERREAAERSVTQYENLLSRRKVNAEKHAEEAERERDEYRESLLKMRIANDIVATENESLRAQLAARDATIARLREVLSTLEWSASSQDSEMSPRIYGLCPDCGYTKEDGHAKSCEIKAALTVEPNTA